MRKLLFICLIAAFSFLIACDDDTEDTRTGELIFKFENKVNRIPLVMNNGRYTNAFVDTFIVTTINYYISNIILEKENSDGSIYYYVVPKEESYFLIRGNESASRTFTLSNIPVGQYTGVSFMVGVDSTKSTADIEERTGVLDPIENDDMYWTWNSGYIFFKLEGRSPQAPEVNGQQLFRYHIGGFGGYDGETFNNLRRLVINSSLIKYPLVSFKIMITTQAFEFNRFQS